MHSVTPAVSWPEDCFRAYSQRDLGGGGGVAPGSDGSLGFGVLASVGASLTEAPVPSLLHIEGCGSPLVPGRLWNTGPASRTVLQPAG
jgi:hypothetical protein